MKRSLVSSLALFAGPVLMLGLAACSSGNNNSAATNNAANSSAASTVNANAPVVTPAAQVGGTPGAAPTITEVATDNVYSVTKMSAPAGQPLTVIVKNNGAIHNWHLQGVPDASGKDIMTPLQQGPTTSSVTFTITKPGVYNFICDAHPADMKGTLTIY